MSGTHHYTVRPAYHRPKFFRYRVGTPARFRWEWNDYRSKTTRARIGFAVVIGHYAYCVKWADSKVTFRPPASTERNTQP